MAGSAVFSPCGTYRYTLERSWQLALGDEPRTILFVLLNPSTADASMDDPTVRRCIGFAARWRFCDLIVCNLFALRSTDPDALYDHDDPVGPENDEWIRRSAERASMTVAGWGVHGGRLADRGAVVLAALRAAGPVYCLGTTEGGHPRHPLYLRGDVHPRELDG